MPIPLIPILLAVIFGLVVAAAALTVWNAVTEFMLATLLPWFDANMPELAPLARELFCGIDRVTVPLVQFLRTKWRKLRHWVLQHLVEVERTTRGEWIHRVVTFLRKQLESGQTEIIKVVTETTISDPMQLPPEVREQVIRAGRARVDLNPQVDKALDRLGLEAQA